MRIDKFLKIPRLAKKRTVAKEACEGGRVEINDEIAKPGDDVKIDDVIEISLGQGEFRCRVVNLKSHVRESEAQSLCESL